MCPNNKYSRRTVLAGASVASSALAARFATSNTAAAAPGAAQQQVFQHGLASGDPEPTSVLLWTRVTSHPGDTPGSGQGRATTINWQVATDDSFQKIVRTGTVTATAQTDMTVKVIADQLEPYRRYAYRFVVASGPYQGQVSPTGWTQTAPADQQQLASFRIGLFSCANWEAGFFRPYQDAARRGDLDLIVHVGDYLYEYPSGFYGGTNGQVVRPHEPREGCQTLAQYRIRYGHYHTDPMLQELHAAAPWVVTWDDHEFADDNWAEGADGDFFVGTEEYLPRKNAAAQAYLEWLPIRGTSPTQGGHIYRQLNFGPLFNLTMLDLRSYRSQKALLQATDEPSRTMLGQEQYEWFMSTIKSAASRWNLVGNSVMMTPMLIPAVDRDLFKPLTKLFGLAQDGFPYNEDSWDGFTVERTRLLQELVAAGKRNTVFLTGDIHTSWGAVVPVIPGKYRPGDFAALEFITPSVTAANFDELKHQPENSLPSRAAAKAFTVANPYISYCDLDRHGYCVLEIRPEQIRCDWIYVQEKADPNSPMYLGAAMAGDVQGVRFVAGQLLPHEHQLAPQAR